MSKNNQKVGDGKFVGYAYKLYNTADEALLFEAPVSAPDMMVYGVSRDVIPGLTAALKGLAAGDKFSVTLPPRLHLENILQTTSLNSLAKYSCETDSWQPKSHWAQSCR